MPRVKFLKNEPTLLTVPEVAEVLRLSKASVYRHVNAGLLPGAFRIGSTWRIPRAELERLIPQVGGGVAWPAGNPKRAVVARQGAAPAHSQRRATTTVEAAAESEER